MPAVRVFSGIREVSFTLRAPVGVQALGEAETEEDVLLGGKACDDGSEQRCRVGSSLGGTAISSTSHNVIATGMLGKLCGGNASEMNKYRSVLCA